MMTIDADMSASGQIAVLGTVMLEGRFDGDIVCTKLVVGPDGYLHGGVVAEEVVVAGQVVGSVRAIRVHLLTSAILEGEVSHESLQMDGAATLVGESRRHKSLVMPDNFVALRRSARESEVELRNLEVQSRVRRTGSASQADAAFVRLRGRFPAAMG